MKKIGFYVLEVYFEVVKSVMFVEGVGKIGKY